MEDPSYIQILLEEYRALDRAGAEAGSGTHTALQWGSAAIAVLAAAALTQWRKHDAAVELVFLLVIPFLSSMSMFFWLGELARIRRLSDYVCVLELKIGLLTRKTAERKTLEVDWGAEVQRLAIDLDLQIPVAIDADPLAWQRWLKRLRNAQAGATFGHLSWIYRIRAGLFPAVTFGSWAIGLYYVSTGGATGHAPEAVAMCILGALIAVVATWLEIELALELERSSGPRGPRAATGLRAACRRIVGSSVLLNIRDWRRHDGPPSLG